MEDIELIVKIDADVYTRLFDNGIQDNEIATDDICEMAKSIRKGTPLPKGHGRLIDADAIENYIKEDADEWDEYALAYFENAPTIIGADKSESEE